MTLIEVHEEAIEVQQSKSCCPFLSRDQLCLVWFVFFHVARYICF